MTGNHINNKHEKPRVFFWCVLIIGIINSFSFDLFYFFVCLLSDYACDGDVAGGVMMLYGIVIFPFSIFIGLASFITIILHVMNNRNSLYKIHFYGIALYFSAFFLGAHKIFYAIVQSY